jgi:uncharacterized protein (DUF736 family)
MLFDPHALRPRYLPVSEAAVGGLHNLKGEKTMAIIGHFWKQEDGSFEGNIATLTNSREVVLFPLAKKGDKSPDYRIMFGSYDIGAVWKNQGDNGEYLSVKLDDPAFPAPVNCRLVKADKERSYSLIWERDRKRS